jgi:hypothetical protein
VCTKSGCFEKCNGNCSIAAEHVLLRRKLAPFRRVALPGFSVAEQVLLRRRRVPPRRASLESGLRQNKWPAAAAVSASIGALGGLTAGSACESLVGSRLDAARKVLNAPSRGPGTESGF